jgi:hypothetical protein
MTRKQEPKWNLEELRDADICAAIRYLDPDPSAETNREGNSAPFVICTSLFVLLLGCVALIWLYCRVLGVN